MNEELREVKIDQFLTQQYGWGPEKTLRDIFEERGIKEILRDFYDYIERADEEEIQGAISTVFLDEFAEYPSKTQEAARELVQGWIEDIKQKLNIP